MWSPPWRSHSLGFGPRPEHVRVKEPRDLNLFFHDAFGPRIAARTEFFAILALTQDFRPVFLKVLAEGKESEVSISKRDVFEAAGKPGVVWVVLMHNHPSGATAPSREDIQLTEIVRQILWSTKTAYVWDHIITTANDEKYHSLRKGGELRVFEDIATIYPIMKVAEKSQ